MRGHCFFSDFGQEVEDGYWAVVYVGVFVKCRFFEERHDNSLFKPDTENTFKEGKVYDIGDWSEEDIKAFLDDKSGRGFVHVVGDLDMSFLTSSSVNGSKERSEGGV